MLRFAPVTLRRMRAALACLALAGGLVALPVLSLPGHPPQAAQAAVTAGDLVFERVGSTSSDIFLRKASNGSEVNLTNAAGSNSDPDVSPDGRKVVFRSSRSGFYSLFLMNNDGSGQVQLTNANRSR